MTAAKQIKDRAKVIFSKTYGYPAMPLRSIGRPCFVWAILAAHHEAAEAERIAAVSATEKAARAAALRNELAAVHFIDNTALMIARREAITAELSRLAA